MNALDQLVKGLSILPGVGRRTAERMALKLALGGAGPINQLIQSLQAARDNLQCCTRCGNLTTHDQDPCNICSDSRRDSALLCVVEDPGDINRLEQAGGYPGQYFCLMGKIAPMKGETVSQRRLQTLLDRLKHESVREVILALNSDVEGDATASYVHEVLSPAETKITRIAFGIPAGSGLAYSDPLTLRRAMKGRQNL